MSITMRRLWPLLFVLLLAAPAQAVRFELQSGSVELFLQKGGVDYAGIGPFDLNGPDDFADFETAPVSLADFQFSALDLWSLPIAQLASGGVLPGLWGWFQLDVDVVATPGAGYTGTGQDLGGGLYALQGTNVDLTGTVTVHHWNGFSQSVVLSFPEYVADASLMSSVLTLDKVRLGGVTLFDEGGNDHVFELVADIVFVGVVPEPGTALLLGVGLLALAIRRRRA